MPETGGLDGVRLLDLTTFSDDRGALTETYRVDWFPELPRMVQCNVSRSRAGVLRGMHFHRRQADYWCVLEGRAFIGLFDLRAGSPTEGRADHLEIDASESRRGLYLPPGVAHGFFALTDLILQYHVDLAFDGTDEFGFSWRDPQLGIGWPAGDPILSERDAGAPPLAEALADPPGWAPARG